jgi:hypothetical protein
VFLGRISDKYGIFKIELHGKISAENFGSGNLIITSLVSVRGIRIDNHLLANPFGKHYP